MATPEDINYGYIIMHMCTKLKDVEMYEAL